MLSSIMFTADPRRLRQCPHSLGRSLLKATTTVQALRAPQLPSDWAMVDQITCLKGSFSHLPHTQYACASYTLWSQLLAVQTHQASNPLQPLASHWSRWCSRLMGWAERDLLGNGLIICCYQTQRARGRLLSSVPGALKIFRGCFHQAQTC